MPLSWLGLFSFTRGWQYGNATDIMDDCLKMAAVTETGAEFGVCFCLFKTLFLHLLRKLFYTFNPAAYKLARNIKRGGRLCHWVSKWVHSTHTNTYSNLHLRKNIGTDRVWLYSFSVKCKMNKLFANGRNETLCLLIFMYVLHNTVSFFFFGW